MKEFTTFREIVYERPDFRALSKELRALTKRVKKASDYEEIRKIFGEAETLISGEYTAREIASIRNTCDKTDAFYEKEVGYLDRQDTILQLRLLGLIKALIASPFRERFDEEYGDFLTKKFENMIKLMKLSAIPEMLQENRLSQRYSRDAALCSTEFRGEKNNFYGLLKHMESTDRTERKEAFEAWAALYESVSPKLDDTYDRLVRLRVKKAKKLGFRDYIDYIYLARDRYDYNRDYVERFRGYVKDLIVPVCEDLYRKQAERLGVDRLRYYDEMLVFPEGNSVPQGTRDELVEKARKMYASMSKESGEYFSFMCEHELFDLDTRPGKHLGGYCTFLPDYRAPFIFSNFNGTSADVDVLTHEAGHAFQCYLASRTQKTMLNISSTSEINEIHSMSMEHFAYPYMESFFGEAADRYRYAHLVSALCTIPYLVSVDEFQHRVFEDPSMDASGRRACWREIEKKYMPWRDYDGNAFLEGGGFWMQKQHIFLYPFYYVDYALAQICAFQFFIRDREDHEKAWNDYVSLCRRGGSIGYMDLLSSAELDSPFEKETVDRTVRKITEIISEFEMKL